MSQEKVTDRDLTEWDIDSLVDIVCPDGKSADCDAVKEELVRREEHWAARINKISDELFHVTHKMYALQNNLREKEDKLEDEEKARRREEKLLRRGQQQSEMTVRLLYDKAKEMMAETSKWRDLAHRVDVLELKHKILFPWAVGQTEQSDDSDGGISPGAHV